MDTEYEATFTSINKDKVREKLTSIGATCKRPEFPQKRIAFNLPPEIHTPDTWLRVRDEQDKITMTLKKIVGKNIEDQKELEIEISDFETGVRILEEIGCQRKALQETKRELWEHGGVEIMIDTWPHLEPFIEIEGKTEQKVREVSEKLDFNWNEARFCAVGTLYAEKYGITEEAVNHAPEILFDSENPFIDKK